MAPNNPAWPVAGRTGNVLVVDATNLIGPVLTPSLNQEGYVVLAVTTATAAFQAIRAHSPDIMVLDGMLPDVDSLAFVRELRNNHNWMPIIVVSPRDSEADIVHALQTGADDYVNASIGVEELLARIGALGRRCSSAPGGRAQPPAFGDITINVDGGEAYRSGNPLRLRPKEFDLLVALYRNRGRILSRSALLRDVWGVPSSDGNTRTVISHIASLRRKIEHNPARPQHIISVRTRGYRLDV